MLKGDGQPYVSKTANLRRRLQRFLAPAAEHSRRLNLRDRVREVEYTLTGSDFESQLLLYRVLRQAFPNTYAARLRLRPAPLLKLHLENEYPRASVTTRLGKLAPTNSGNLYYGPFPSRVMAEKFASDVLDYFKMRRCVDDLRPDPAFPGCVYSEMKMCMAPCFKGCTDEEYRAEVARVQNFFDSGGESLERELADQRELASTKMAFEEAAAIHAKVEKLKPLLSQLPEIVRRIDQLDAIIVQPSAEPHAVCLFRFRNAQFTGPMLFKIELSAESQITDPACESARTKPRTLESRVQEAVEAFPVPQPASTPERTEQLAILKRWFCRSHRAGEIFFADEKGAWPLRRIVRGIGRVYTGEKSDERFGFSATESEPPPS